ncbi:MAG: histidine kinase [Actinomycetota bacterium]
MRQRTTARLAWGVLVLSVALYGAGVTLLALNAGAPARVTYGTRYSVAFTGLAYLVFPAVGALVLSRRASNPVGWLMLVMGPVFGTQTLAGEWAIYALLTNPGFRGGVVASWVAGWVWVPSFATAATFLLLLFPDGSLPSPRWRPVGWITGIVIGLAAVGFAFAPGQLEEAPVPLQNPYGVGRPAAELFQAMFLLAPILFLVSATSLVVRYRRSGTEQREQLKWLAFAAAVVALGFLLVFLLSLPRIMSDFEQDLPTWMAIVQDVVTLSVAGIPVAIGFAILKYRLYDIDVVINKTVVFALLAGFFTAVYVAIVVGIGALVGARAGPFLTVVAAVVIAVAFNPVRERARHLANRLVYGKRATPYEVLSEFSERMAGIDSMDDILPRTARILAEGTGAERAEVWLRVGAEIRLAAAWAAGRTTAPRGAEEFPLVDGESPELPGMTRSVGVRHQGEVLGAVAVMKPAGEPLTPTEDKLVSDLAAQAGLVLRNARLTAELQARLEELSVQAEELRASRQRLVGAQNEERRRLERNLHDGAQQEIVALAVKQRLIGALLERDPAKVRELLAELQAETQDALETLRELARGIYPPLLADKGLADALRAQAKRAPVPVAVETDAIGRYSQELEAAVYFCCLEAPQNVAKYAQASWVEIRLGRADDALTFTVRDDGVGFDAATVARGAGLTNMADRVSALGGTLAVESAPGLGTTVTGLIPVEVPSGEPGNPVAVESLANEVGRH